MGYEQKMILVTPYHSEKVICLDNFPLTKKIVNGEVVNGELVSGGFSVYSHKYENGEKIPVSPYFYLADGNTKVELARIENRISADDIFDATICGVIAMIDLCKIGNVLLASKTETKVAYYGQDGNTLICKDNYDACLCMYEAGDVLAAFKEANKNYVTDTSPRGYRRLAMAIDLLEGAVMDFNPSELKVTFFGH